MNNIDNICLELLDKDLILLTDKNSDCSVLDKESCHKHTWYTKLSKNVGLYGKCMYRKNKCYNDVDGLCQIK